VTGKSARFVITTVALDAFLKFMDRPVFHDLSEDQLALVHGPLSLLAKPGLRALSAEKSVKLKTRWMPFIPHPVYRLAGILKAITGQQ
jgi:hypothetical protein